MGFPRQEYWSGLPFPCPKDLPDPGIKPTSPAFQADSFCLSYRGFRYTKFFLLSRLNIKPKNLHQAKRMVSVTITMVSAINSLKELRHWNDFQPWHEHLSLSWWPDQTRIGTCPTRTGGFPQSASILGFPFGSAGKQSLAMQEIPGFDPWVGKIPWRRERLPTPVFWPGEFHGLYSPWGRKESHTTDGLSLSLSTRIRTSSSRWTPKSLLESHISSFNTQPVPIISMSATMTRILTFLKRTSILTTSEDFLYNSDSSFITFYFDLYFPSVSRHPSFLSLFEFLQYRFCFVCVCVCVFCLEACGIWAPQPGNECTTLHGRWSPSHWITREVRRHPSNACVFPLSDIWTEACKTPATYYIYSSQYLRQIYF